MKTPFENWIENNITTQEIIDIFSDAVMCYKIGVYRAAFLLSYIGLQNILREKIKFSPNRPNNFDEGKWQQILSLVANEDKWDDSIHDCMMRQPPNNIFTLANGTERVYDSFRIIRNTCAHGKKGTVTASHVECLWLFIMEHYTEFTVNGGLPGVMESIEAYYNPISIATDIDVLVKQIKSVIVGDKIPDFIRQFYEYCKNSIMNFAFDKDNKFMELWEKLLLFSTPEIHNGIIEFIINSDTDNVLCTFIAKFPQTLLEFVGEEKYVRKICVEKLWIQWDEEKSFWDIIEKMLENNSIPDNLKDEFSLKLYNYLNTSYPDEKAELLFRAGYFNLLAEKKLFRYSNYEYPNGMDFANFHIKQFLDCIKYVGLTKDAIVCINTIFKFATFGDFFAGIVDFMQSSENVETYKRVSSENGFLVDYSEKFIRS